MKRVCVFCGSNDGTVPGHTDLAIELGQLLAQRDIELVYGGGEVGLMGTIAATTMAAGGKVIGVIPQGLFSTEIPNEAITELHKVPDMHARKSLMYALSDGFIALPGGLGTLEEVFEAATWTQIKLHDRPKRVVLLDRDGFWDQMTNFLDSVVDAGFIRSGNRAIIHHANTPSDALQLLTEVHEVEGITSLS